MNNELPDYYGVLNVARTATTQEISRAYRALMRLHHPDLEGTSKEEGRREEGRGGGGARGVADGGTNSSADGRLLGIMEAFAVLRDAKTRAEYDRALSVPPINPPRINRGGARDVPVRRVRTAQPPLLRVTPVLWERGPWPGTGEQRRSIP